MRLRSIKLAGFKSFVEPVHFQVPGQRVGIVGPNGCGKSNLIDAVRWVLGESRAAELRGESMQDVIFNGSGHRKPANRASVELVFEHDGSDTAGPWSPYAEIAVKRVLTREGLSHYFINQQNVRRRDVQDIFLGTGLGPRAYAIIGQGMIARIIEAKPEELRIFLEETAGVSKYKARRRETENRLSDARTHLTRIADIQRELRAHLDKLEQQAARAQQYQTLSAERDAAQQLLWRIQKDEAQAEVERQQQALNAAQAQLDAQTAQLSEIEAQLEIVRAAHADASDTVSSAQGALYEAQADISRLESECHFVTEARRRTQTHIATLEAQRVQGQTQLDTARAELAHAQQAYTDAQARRTQAQAAAQTDSVTLPEIDARVAAARNALTAVHTELNQLEQTRALNTAQHQHAEQLFQQLEARAARLQRTLETLALPEVKQLDRLQTQLAEREAQRDEAQMQLTQAHAAARQADQTVQTVRAAVQKETALLHQYTARLDALQHVQRTVQSGGAMAPWLAQCGLAERTRLWQKLHIEAGWETALEAVLRERLGAFELIDSDTDTVSALAARVPPAKLALYGPPPQTAVPPELDASGVLQPLAARVQTDDPAVRMVLLEALHHVYTAENLEEIEAARRQLPPGGVFVVPAGHQVTRAGVQLYAADSEQSGVLARAQEIERLAQRVRAQTEAVEVAQAEAAQAEAAQQRARRALADVRTQHEQAMMQVHTLQLETQKRAQADQNATERRAQLEEELAELDAHMVAQRARIDAGAEHLKRVNDQLGPLNTRLEEAKHIFELIDAERIQTHQRARASERAALDAQYAARAAESRVDALNGSIQTAQAQASQTHTALERMRTELAAIDLETPQRGLEKAQTVCEEKETQLAKAREALDTLTAQLRAADEARLKAAHTVAPLQARIAELQLKVQAAQLQRDQFAAQLQACGADASELTQKQQQKQQQADGPSPAVLQREVTRLSRAMEALGAINMAALEELAAARERAQFLSAQSEDLNAAIRTLEDAMRTIDRETRQLLQQTFDAVNRHFGELFPRLFGGGQAKLKMTGDEILNAGVQVTAQPPGKKNATIHLLSGGEKALTATALVFALFQLNPAPFCLLDEVDAPLDEANTGRFVQLVRAMSGRTQFLFITHSQQTMEMAQQLIGVTMQEQGVSRIVAVDI